MPTTPSAVASLAAELVDAHAATWNDERAGSGRIARYLRGDHDLPYMPRGARNEYRSLAEKAITPWLPLISETYVKSLFVDGYRPARSTQSAPPWAYWQANRLDARQTIAHRGALEFGASYTIVLPGEPGPSIRPVPPAKTIAFFEDDDDKWPVHGLRVKGTAADGMRLWELFDDEAVHLIGREKGSDRLTLICSDEHGLRVSDGPLPRPVGRREPWHHRAAAGPSGPDQ